MPAPNTTDTAAVFEKRFGAPPAVRVRAPGRVNLIGEHIDYNGGYVLPMAIDRTIEIAASAGADGCFRLYSVQYDESYEGPILRKAGRRRTWANYLFGVILEFEKLGHSLEGMEAVVSGDVPRGSGLSSSAALEVAAAWVVQQLAGSDLSRMDIALLGQRAENRFVGVNCGIMDQAIAACGQEGHAMLLNCDTLEYTQSPVAGPESDVAVLVAHSGVHRGLSASAYNERRSQCDQARDVISGAVRPIAYLCAATVQDLEAAKDDLAPKVLRRARHAVSEQQRVRQAVEALRAGDMKAFGDLLNASHASLKEDYEVSCPELDQLTDMIRSLEGVYGSRLTGAGFGGSTVSLVAAGATASIVAHLIKEYYQAESLEPIVFTTGACEGVRVVE